MKERLLVFNLKVIEESNGDSYIYPWYSFVSQDEYYAFDVALSLTFTNMPISTILPEIKPLNAPYIK
jgi:hypothetical protein